MMNLFPPELPNFNLIRVDVSLNDTDFGIPEDVFDTQNTTLFPHNFIQVS